MLTKSRLTDIIENYSQVLEEKDDKGRKKHKQVFPRYHQLGVGSVAPLDFQWFLKYTVVSGLTELEAT